MNTRSIDNATIKAISDAVRKGRSADNAEIKAVDLLMAAGFRKETDFISPKSNGSTCSTEEWNTLKDAVAKGFPKETQSLMDADISGLTASQKDKRKKAQQAIGAYIGRFKASVKRRNQLAERPDVAAGKGAKGTKGANNTKRTKRELMLNAVNDQLKRIQNDNAPDYPTNEVLKHFNALVKLLSKPVK